jgi:simple sugar transport system ATP-binding protein
LSEIAQIADHLVVLREGKIHDRQSAPFNMSAAVSSMLGHNTSAEAAQVDEIRGSQVSLAIENEQLLHSSQPISLDFRAGEVTGVVGLIGAGKSELARRIFGADRMKTGTMTLKGKQYSPRHPREAVKQGVYLVPEDRAAESMLPGWSISATSSLPFLGQWSRFGVLNLGKERDSGAQILEDYSVVATGPDQSMDALSGGNQQKVVVGRWQRANPQVLLLDEPFRGVDLGARREISQKAREQARSGATVVVFVSDVDELREIADRIVVLVEGKCHLDAYSSEVDNNAVIQAMSEVQ